MTAGVNAEYGTLLSAKRPHVIKTAREYKSCLAELKGLMESERLSSAQEEYLDLLSALIEKYEDERYELPRAATPAEALRELVRARDITVTELGRLINSKGTASQMLSGDRAISKEAAKRFARYFHVPVTLFL